MKKLKEFYEKDLLETLYRKGTSDEINVKKLETFRYYASRFMILDATQEKILRYIFTELKDDEDSLFSYLLVFLTYQHLGPHRLAATFKNLPKSLEYMSEFITTQDITEDLIFKYEKEIDFNILRYSQLISKRDFVKYQRDKFPDIRKYEDYCNELKVSVKNNLL